MAECGGKAMRQRKGGSRAWCGCRNGQRLGALTRRAALGSFGTVVPVLAAACGRAGDDPSSVTVAQPVTITAWFPVTGAFAPFLQSQVDLFQQANAKVRVTVEGPGADDKLQAAVIAGNPPDVQHSNYIPMFNWVR